WAELNKIEAWEDKDDPRGKKIEFDPKIFSILSTENNRRFYWFPYWLTVDGKRKFGQFSPIIPEEEFITLFTNALKRGVISPKVKKEISKFL
ncbi:MAG: hypothetical protein KKC68_05625, partial [Candidatus Thermoplasmatota archaeon]|nr:hypothetical protein [Candidatus Thermoplasmatota archaeon]MBU1941235.1 hypothetical protein [Candidatus Thermoplasmatota archaeon]